MSIKTHPSLALPDKVIGYKGRKLIRAPQEVGWYDLVSPVTNASVPPAAAPSAAAFGPSGDRREYSFSVS